MQVEYARLDRIHDLFVRWEFGGWNHATQYCREFDDWSLIRVLTFFGEDGWILGSKESEDSWILYRINN